MNHEEVIKKFYEVSQMLLTENKEVQMIFFAIKEEEVYPILTKGIKTEDFPKVVWEILNQKEADAVFVITEAWIVREKVPEGVDPRKMTREDAKKFYGAPSDHPERQEVLNLMYMDAYGENCMFICGDIERDPTGTPFVRDYELIKDLDNLQSRLFAPWKYR